MTVLTSEGFPIILKYWQKVTRNNAYNLKTEISS